MTTISTISKMAEETSSGCCIPPHFTKKCIAILSALAHANSDQRRALLQTSDKCVIRCICECALNVLKGVVKLPEKQIKKLKKYKKIIRNLVKVNDLKNRKKNSKKVNWLKKKKQLVQTGRGALLPLLLTPIVEILVSKLLKN